MLAKDFKAKVNVGSKIVANGNTFVCTSAINGFMYEFKNVDINSDNPIFALFGVTDGSVKDIELAMIPQTIGEFI